MTDDIERIVLAKIEDVLKDHEELELDSVKADPSYDSESETLSIDITMKMHKPVEKVEYTFTKPEGMTDEQFQVFIKHLQKEIEEQNVNDFELTS